MSWLLSLKVWQVNILQTKTCKFSKNMLFYVTENLSECFLQDEEKTKEVNLFLFVIILFLQEELLLIFVFLISQEVQKEEKEEEEV